ncbi:MAG TPA: helix-turn-helix domain-containing protein [Polyangia bacterium]|nr:helix-turn-helix domain-containing protein [Polyangia bacterium]
MLSVKQVAEHLGVTTATVYGLCAHGRLAHVRVLNVIRVTPSDLSEFIASCRRLTRPQSATSNGRRG